MQKKWHLLSRLHVFLLPALMQLKHSIKFNVTTRPTVCLPDRRKRIHDYYNCYVVGWGHTSFNGTQPDELRHAKVYTVPNSVCNKEVAYNNSVNPKELICAGYKNGGIDACNYDSGGGLVCNKEGKFLLCHMQKKIIVEIPNNPKSNPNNNSVLPIISGGKNRLVGKRPGCLLYLKISLSIREIT